jgi:hypothetical protein
LTPGYAPIAIRGPLIVIVHFASANALIAYRC